MLIQHSPKVPVLSKLIHGTTIEEALLYLAEQSDEPELDSSEESHDESSIVD